MTKIIINADDLGISHEVNKAIENAIKNGVISSSTIIANGPAFNEAIQIVKQYPEISVGAHLNLIEFHPLTNQELFNKYELTDSEGNFREGAIFLIKVFTKELLHAIEEELDAQLTKIEKSGITISHIDSHQHTHTIPQLRDVIVSIMTKHKISRVRRVHVPSIRLMLASRRNEVVHLDKSTAVQPKRKNILIRRIKLLFVICQTTMWNRFFKNQFVVTDDFYAYRTLYYNFHILKRKVEGKTVELMCHPGHPAFVIETELILSNVLKEKTSFQLITYNNL